MSVDHGHIVVEQIEDRMGLAWNQDSELKECRRRVYITVNGPSLGVAEEQTLTLADTERKHKGKRGRKCQRKRIALQKRFLLFMDSWNRCWRGVVKSMRVYVSEVCRRREDREHRINGCQVKSNQIRSNQVSVVVHSRSRAIEGSRQG